MKMDKVAGAFNRRNNYSISESKIFQGFPKLGIPFLGVPMMRTILYWGLYWGTLILGNYHLRGVSTTSPESKFFTEG